MNKFDCGEGIFLEVKGLLNGVFGLFEFCCDWNIKDEEVWWFEYGVLFINDCFLLDWL